MHVVFINRLIILLIDYYNID